MKTILEKILKVLAGKILKKYLPEVIAITGSVGKTSPKEQIQVVLAKHFSVQASFKNYNNEIGVPLTIIGEESPGKSLAGWLRVFKKAGSLLWGQKDYPQILVLEMGAQKPGDIDYLLGFVHPKIGVLTDISGSHLEYFGTLSKVEKEKRKIIERLPKKGVAIVNFDNELTRRAGEKAKSRVVSYGFSKRADVQATEVDIVYEKTPTMIKPAGISFKLITEGNVVPVLLPHILSPSQIYSALAAIVVGQIYNLNALEVLASLKKFMPPPGRLRLLKGIKQSWILDDTYNASPQSTKAALEVLGELEVIKGGKKIAVLGDMLELGKDTEKEHREAGFKVAESGVDLLITKGSLAKFIAQGAQKAGLDPSKIFTFSKNKEAGLFLQEKIEKGDIVLIKGSQGMYMEEIVKEVMAYPLRAKELLVRQD